MGEAGDGDPFGGVLNNTPATKKKQTNLEETNKFEKTYQTEETKKFGGQKCSGWKPHLRVVGCGVPVHVQQLRGGLGTSRGRGSGQNLGCWGPLLPILPKKHFPTHRLQTNSLCALRLIGPSVKRLYEYWKDTRTSCTYCTWRPRPRQKCQENMSRQQTRYCRAQAAFEPALPGPASSSPQGNCLVSGPLARGSGLFAPAAKLSFCMGPSRPCFQLLLARQRAQQSVEQLGDAGMRSPPCVEV